MSRADQKAETRARVVDAARELFRSHGFKATTIARVAERAGVATGTVMVHFPDKSALVAGAFHEDLERTIGRAWATLPKGDLLSRLRHLAGCMYTWYAEDPALSRALLRESLFLEGAPLADQVARFVAAVAGLIAQAIARGEVRPGLPADLVATGFFADYLAVLLAGLQGSLPTVEQQLELLESLTRLRLGGAS